MKAPADVSHKTSRIFGAKESDARTRLEEVFAKLEATHDLTANRVKNAVKTGGEMISGQKHIDVYISYKNKSNFGAFLGLIQDDAASEMKARVGYYKTGRDSFREEQLFLRKR